MKFQLTVPLVSNRLLLDPMQNLNARTYKHIIYKYDKYINDPFIRLLKCTQLLYMLLEKPISDHEYLSLFYHGSED